LHVGERISNNLLECRNDASLKNSCRRERNWSRGS
jgi:hypothetical protein